MLRTEDAGPPSGGVTVSGFKVAVIPVGTLRILNATAVLKVPIDWTPTSIVVPFPTITDLLIGEGVT